MYKTGYFSIKFKISAYFYADIDVFQRMVRLCGEVLAGPTEAEEMQLLLTICAKLKTDAYLVNFFIEVGFGVN